MLANTDVGLETMKWAVTSLFGDGKIEAYRILTRPETWLKIVLKAGLYVSLKKGSSTSGILNKSSVCVSKI